MAGNSQRRGAMRSSKKPRTVGTGGKNKRRLEGKGPTPKAADREGHVAKRRADAKERSASDASSSGRSGGSSSAGRSASASGSASAGRSGSGSASRGRRSGASAAANELVLGRNQVLEALVANVPCKSLHVQRGIDADPRVKQAMSIAATNGLPIKEHSKSDLDAMADGVVHQGIALTTAPYEYSDLSDILGLGTDRRPALLIALDGVTDTRNLGAIARSAAAFGGTGLIIPSRRSATVNAAAWRTSAGALAHIPVAMVTNLTRALVDAQKAGFTVVGLAGEGASSLDSLDIGNEPVVLVVGSEGKGLGRLVSDTCDYLASIPIDSRIESLNASVAASIAMYSLSIQR